MSFDAILLAAGMGTRLRPLTDLLPKCLVPIHGRPLLDYWLEPLVTAGVDQILINTHYKSELVESYVQMTPWRHRITIVHEPVLLGTAGTLMCNKAFVTNQPCLLAHADNLSVFAIDAFVQAHRNRLPEALITMMTFTTSTPETCGIVVTDQRGLVTEFYEKVAQPPSNHANAAVFMLDDTLIATLEQMPEPLFELSTDVLPHLLGRIGTWHNDGYHRDIGSIESWQQANSDAPQVLEDATGRARWATFCDMHIRSGSSITPAVHALLDQFSP